ncbi:hypothetical protein OE88DRAFT_1738304 [Heliocybe sulcata]|uniref:Uncharacterized protein n=1 Tax=Heliocybe sulcata TaxID=5364 RepID=A0A5C3MRU0_9AGAM|nr:hypothetical protein OE88DRAFT_1738304 [Heliocybe sulcata]
MAITYSVEHGKDIATCQIRTFTENGLRKLSIAIVPRDVGLNMIKLNISLNNEPCEITPTNPVIVPPGTPSSTRLLDWVEGQVNGPPYPDVEQGSVARLEDGQESELLTATESDSLELPPVRYSPEEVRVFLEKYRDTGKMPMPFNMPKKRKPHTS